jgi:hypothetical protein
MRGRQARPCVNRCGRCIGCRRESLSNGDDSERMGDELEQVLDGPATSPRGWSTWRGCRVVQWNQSSVALRSQALTCDSASSLATP